MGNAVSPRLHEALTLAFELHGRDSRKSSPVPIMAHLLSVCALVQHDGGDEDEAIAALLHDSLEDKPDRISRAEIERRFGTRVLSLVALATDTPAEFAGGEKPSWRTRKEDYIRRVAQEPPDSLRVTIADKVDNLRAILADHRRVGDSLWSRFNAGKTDQIWYYRRALEAYDTAGAAGALMNELRTLVGRLEKL